MEDKQNLIASLAHWLAAGKLEARFVLPAIQRLTGDNAPPKSLLALLEAFGAETDGAFALLAPHLRETLRQEALRFYKRRSGPGAPQADPNVLRGQSLEVEDEWRFAGVPAAAVEVALRTTRELSFLAMNQEKAPQLFREVKRYSSQTLAAASAAIAPQMERSLPLQKQLENALPAGIPGRDALLNELRKRALTFWKAWSRKADILSQVAQPDPGDSAVLSVLVARFAASPGRDEKSRILDSLCSWPTPEALTALRGMTMETWAQDRALLNLSLRFGQPDLHTWQQWLPWLSSQLQLWQAEQESLSRLIQDQSRGVLLILYSQLPDPDPAVFDTLIKILSAAGRPIEPRDLVNSWSASMPMNEQRALLGLPEPALPPVISEFGTAAAGQQQVPAPPILPIQPEAAFPPTAEPTTPLPAEPPVPPKPSIWEKHIQPLFVENWYIVAGIAMVILGSSLLAYYTWDKHWLVRYTIMPLLLAVFTWSLAGVGRWIEQKDSEFKSTAAILRGAAIGLLPINFMAMALLSADEKVPRKGPALIVMAIIYLLVFGWGLRSWCTAVEPALGNLLAGTLLLLNALVAVGPLARTMGHVEGEALMVYLAAGFYLGFLLTAGTIMRFTRKILTRQMAEEKRVPWFLAAALGITYLQVFVWVHGFMRLLPHAYTYALLVIAIGWLILYSERRALELRESPQMHGGESFLGFAFILLGLLMGFTEPAIRILSFGAAGSVWLYQAFSRRHPLHYWIALTLLGLGVASVGLLPRFPGAWLPLLGVVLAVAFGLGGRLSRKRNQADLAQACVGMQVVALVVTTVVAPLAQWHYHSAPLATAGWLVIVAALFTWRALKEQKIHWLHATMVVMALVLPYAGFLDMTRRTAHHNTLVFGLAILSYLWLAVTRLRPTPLILQARSTVLWFYGSLAVAALLLRVALGDTLPDPLWYRDYMDYTGPILMMLALIPATYYSRSLVPATMAVGIMAILFPELKANLQQSTPWLSWGSGLGSALWGLALAWLCFFLRQWSFLKSLPEGDRFMGKELFPFRRYDHTLFTWPILAAVLFLIIKVDTWNLLRNLDLAAGGVPLKTAIALGVTGIAWTFVGIYHRQHRGAVIGVHLGWLWMLAGISFGYWRKASDPYWSWPFLITGLLLQGLYWFYRFRLELIHPWARALLAEPTRAVLLVGSGVLAIICMACLLDGAPLERMQWLYCFLLAQLVWHALGTRHWFFGAILFFQVWIGLLAATAPGVGNLWDRISAQHSLSPTLWLLVGIQLIFIALEFAPTQRSEGRGPRSRLAPLLTPPFLLGTALAFLLGLVGIVDGVHSLTFSAAQQALLLATLLLTARAQVSGLILLPAMLLGYVMLHRDVLAGLTDPEAQLELLATPWRLALLGLGIVLLTQAGRWVHSQKAELVAGPFAKRFLTAPSCGWLFWPATFIAASAAIYHTAHPVLRERAPQLWAPWLGVATFALVAGFWNQSRLFAGAGCLLLLGNIHLVRVFGGDFFRGQGLSELHLVCLGISLALLQASVLRRILRSAQAIVAISLASLGLAGGILVLLSANYFTDPALVAITSTRFIVSGTLAWLAGLYFRRAARHPGPGEERHLDLSEALYHFGVVLAIWCAALLVPWFRQPFFTLIALGLPVAYFYARAELGARAGLATVRRYRNSATVLGFVVLGLYAFKGVFHMILFPGTPISTQYYHYNAPLIMVLGVVLLRLHALGGTGWLAFYGGLALMTGSYFLLTALPGFSPFDFPMPAARCAIGLGHFWVLLSYSRSPLRSLLQRLARLDDATWHELCLSWGRCLLAATQAAAFLGIADYSANTFMVAPLLAGAATIFIHQGIIMLVLAPALAISSDKLVPGSERGVRRKRRAIFYLVVAALELAVALHMDFLIPSYLSKDNIIWALLVIWLGLLAAYQVISGNRFASRSAQASTELRTPLLAPETVGQIALVLAVLVLGHVLYHHPSSAAGLWGMVLGAILAAWNPQRNRQAANAAERICGALLLWIPVWLVYFSQAPLETRGFEGAIEPWPILAATGTIFLTGVFARLFPIYLARGYHKWPRAQFRLFDSTLTWLESTSTRVANLESDAAASSPPQAERAGEDQPFSSELKYVGARIHHVVLWLALFIAGAVQVLHYQAAFSSREIALLTLLEAALAVAWFYEGKARASMVAYYLMQLSAMACFASIRRHLMLTTTGPWNYEYDVWASLAFSFALAGAKQVFDLQPRTLRVPLLTTMFILPLMALVWVIVQGLGVNLALLVVGMHSVMFAYLGRADRESPYNILALAGFVGFILMTFYSKLHLRAIHAYIIPVGLGILILQELFRPRIKPEARNWIRLVTLMAMLGSSGYYALADSRHAITFNLTMVILCLLAMGLGSFFRIRLYLALGFAGLMVDLVSILYKVLVHMERSARMTIIGSLVLLIGAILVFGAIYYKTRKAALDAWVDKWRRKLAGWQ